MPGSGGRAHLALKLILSLNTQHSGQSQKLQNQWRISIKIAIIIRISIFLKFA